MSTHMPGFQSFFSFFASFCIDKINHQGWVLHQMFFIKQVVSKCISGFQAPFFASGWPKLFFCNSGSQTLLLYKLFEDVFPQIIFMNIGML